MRGKKWLIAMGLVLALAMAGCAGSTGDNEEGGAPAWGPMADCVPPGQVRAGVLTSPAEFLWGYNANPAIGTNEKTALNTYGDIMLKNNVAAFVIQRVNWRDSYFNFGGNLLDAVALVNCQQAGPEQFQELQLVVGKLTLPDIENSFLRAVKAESIEIVNDGTNGQPAVVRVRGTEDILHMIELNLIFLAGSLGIPYVSPPPFNFDITIDYILEPDSRALRIELTVKNTKDEPVDLLDGMAMFFGDTTPVRFPYLASVSIQDYGVNVGTPWMLASSPNGDGAWGLTIPTDFMGGASISGVTAALDVNLIPIKNPITGIEGQAVHLEPAGQPGDSYTFVHYFSVGDGSFNTALAPLYDVLTADVLPGLQINTQPLSGHVYDIFTGEPLSGADVRVELCTSFNDDVSECEDGDPNNGNWVFLTGFVSDANGDFSGEIPQLVPSIDPPLLQFTNYRITASMPGRNSPPPIMFTPGVNTEVSIGFMSKGYFYYEIRDSIGRPLPSKITLWQGGSLKYNINTETGIGMEEVAPGIYDVSVTRGIEYTTYQKDGIYVPGNGEYYLTATLDRVVDTTGWMSTDTHIHSGRSPDNYITVEDRIRTCVAEGLEVPVATDHEFIGSWQWAIDKLAVNEWAINITGEEVTAPIPGHTNMFPVVPRFDIDARGGWLQWMFSNTNPGYSMDTQEIFATERAYGAQIVQINHPRSGITSDVKWNRLTGQPDANPADIGLSPNAVLWDWDFNTFELQNGMQNPFLNPSSPNTTGTFDDWMSFLNMGHKKTVVGVSDAHNWEMPGWARSFYRSNTDSPLDFRLDTYIDSLKNGRVVVSTGGFARVRVNNSADIGDTITDTDGVIDLWVHIEAIPEIDITYFKVFVNCNEVDFGGQAFMPTNNPSGVVKFDGVLQIPISEDSHVVVMGFGSSYLPRGLPQFNPAKVPRFTTNAIYIDYDGNGVYDAPGLHACTYSIP